jgi:hypothetical protein
MATHGLSWPAQGTDQDQVQDPVITSFANRDIFAWHLTSCLGSPKEFIAPCEGSHHQSLRANREVFTSQHVNSYGLPKDMTEATCKIHLSLAN